LYTGITTDVAHRVKIHNDGKGAKYTRARRPVVLKWKKRMRDESAARKEEYRIKKLKREEKVLLVKNYELRIKN